MFVYDKKLQYPVKIDRPNPKLAAIIISQYGGPDGELGASLRYLSQRYSMPFDELKGLLTDIGIEDYFWLFGKKVMTEFFGQRKRQGSPLPFLIFSSQPLCAFGWKNLSCSLQPAHLLI